MAKKKQPDPFDYSAFAGPGHNQPGELAHITKLAEEQFALQENVERIEEELKQEKEKLRHYSERLLPDAMEDAGVEEYTTTSKIRVELKEKVRGGLTVENRPKGIAWLEKNGYEGLIETKLEVPYKRGEMDKAIALVKELEDRNVLCHLERSVHHARLDSFIREQLAQGKELPLDIFGVYRQRVVKVDM